MKKALPVLLKLCHLLGLTSLLGVGVLFALSLFQMSYGPITLLWVYGAAFGCYGLCALFALARSRWGKPIKAEKREKVQRASALVRHVVLCLIPAMLLVLFAFVVELSAGVWLTVMGGLFLVAALVIGGSVVLKPYDQMNAQAELKQGTLVFCGFYLFSFLLHWGYDFLVFPYQWYLWLYFPFVLCLVLLGNQVNIDVMMSRRKTGQAMPRKTRWVNFLMTLVLLGTLLLFVTCKDGVVWLIVKLGQGAKSAISAILQMLIPEQGEVGPYSYMDDMNPANQGGGMPIQGEPWPIWDILFYLVIPAMVVFVLVWYRGMIWNWLKEVAQQVGRALLMLMKLLYPDSRVRVEEHEEYVDESTDLTPPEKSQRAGEKQSLKSRRKFLRYLKQVDDPVLYVRECYRYVVEQYRLRGRELKPADTTREIGEKIGTQWNREKVGDINTAYDSVRYGGKVPEREECQKMREECISLLES